MKGAFDPWYISSNLEAEPDWSIHIDSVYSCVNLKDLSTLLLFIKREHCSVTGHCQDILLIEARGRSSVALQKVTYNRNPTVKDQPTELPLALVVSALAQFSSFSRASQAAMRTKEINKCPKYRSVGERIHE